MNPSHPILTDEVRAFVSEARVGRFATVNARKHPVVVPICFALLDGDQIVSVLDEKPKRVADGELARVRNIRQNPAVCLLIDYYDEDWSQLAFAQIHGEARIIDPGSADHTDAISTLRDKYPQYRVMDIILRPVIAMLVTTVTFWRGGTLLDSGQFPVSE